MRCSPRNEMLKRARAPRETSYVCKYAPASRMQMLPLLGAVYQVLISLKCGHALPTCTLLSHWHDQAGETDDFHAFQGTLDGGSPEEERQRDIMHAAELSVFRSSSSLSKVRLVLLFLSRRDMDVHCSERLIE